jgi:hypothetical protein
MQEQLTSTQRICQTLVIPLLASAAPQVSAPETAGATFQHAIANPAASLAAANRWERLPGEIRNIIYRYFLNLHFGDRVCTSNQYVSRHMPTKRRLDSLEKQRERSRQEYEEQKEKRESWDRDVQVVVVEAFDQLAYSDQRMALLEHKAQHQRLVRVEELRSAFGLLSTCRSIRHEVLPILKQEYIPLMLPKIRGFVEARNMLRILEPVSDCPFRPIWHICEYPGGGSRADIRYFLFTLFLAEELNCRAKTLHGLFTTSWWTIEFEGPKNVSFYIHGTNHESEGNGLTLVGDWWRLPALKHIVFAEDLSWDSYRRWKGILESGEMRWSRLPNNDLATAQEGLSRTKHAKRFLTGWERSSSQYQEVKSMQTKPWTSFSQEEMVWYSFERDD